MASSKSGSERIMLQWCITTASVTVLANKCESLLKDLLHRYYIECPDALANTLQGKKDKLEKYNAVRSIWNGGGINPEGVSDKLLEFLTSIHSVMHGLADSSQKTLASKSGQRTPKLDELLEFISDVVDSNTKTDVQEFNELCSGFRALSIYEEPIATKLQVAISRELVSGKEIMNQNLTLNRIIRKIFFDQQTKLREYGGAPTRYNPDADVIAWLKNTRGHNDKTLEEAFNCLDKIDGTRVNFHHAMTETPTAEGGQFQELCKSIKWIAYESCLFEAAFDGMSPVEVRKNSRD